MRTGVAVSGRLRFAINRSALFVLCAVIFVSLFCLASLCGARPAAPPLYQQGLNKIANSQSALAPFYEKLKLLKKGQLNKVTILHIGDSHIQAGSLTARVREPLQELFGNAGRGLCFPYAVARTNGPEDYRISSNVIWDSLRSVRADPSLPMGLTGYTIRTDREDAVLNISLLASRCPSAASCGFDTVAVFHDKGEHAYAASVIDDSSTEEALKEDLSDGGEEAASKFTLSGLVCRASVRMVKTGEDQRYARIYGISLERSSGGGVIYHEAGVNGAGFEHFTQSPHFARQMEFLKPDLVIVSLGTNNAFGRDLGGTEIFRQIDRLYKAIRFASPDTSVLFTTPPDAAAPGKKLTKGRVVKIRNLIVQYCTQRRLGCWDLYQVMGGYGSVSRWRKSGLVQSDMVHCTRPGYELQGRLLFDAILNGYRSYESD